MMKWRQMAWLIVMVFAIRALVPTGYMPGAVALTDGLLTVVVCTSSGAKLITIGDDGEPLTNPSNNEPDHDNAAEPCPYGPMPACSLADHPIDLVTERASSTIERIRQMRFALARRHREIRQAREPPFGV